MKMPVPVVAEGTGSVRQRVCRESPVKGDKMP